jgi:hypothetical protein
MSLTGTLARLLIPTVLLVLAFPWVSVPGEKESPPPSFHHQEKWGFIDQTGKIVIFPKFDALYDFEKGLAPVQRAGVGYIDHSGS